MPVPLQKILDSFPDLVTVKRGSADLAVRDLQCPEKASAESLIFVATATHLRAALSSPAQVWVVATNLALLVPDRVQAVLVSPHVHLAMALIAKTFFPIPKNHEVIGGMRVHPNASISTSARLGANCTIGPGAVIGDDCQLGDDCIIGANTILEAKVHIGARTHIYPLVFVGQSCTIGADCEVHANTSIGNDGFGYAQDKDRNHHRITHYGGVVIEDRVRIGSGVQIDRGTFLDSRIGAGTKIDNHCHFGHNIIIGNNTLITGGMITAGSVTIGSHCVFGGRTTIAGHLSIADHVHIGGMSGITKSILKPGAYSGLPLQDLKQEMRTRASLKHLPTLVKHVRRILRQLKLDSETLNDLKGE